MINNLTNSLNGLSLIMSAGIILISTTFTTAIFYQINQHYYSEEQRQILLKQQALELEASTLASLLEQVRFNVEALAQSTDLTDLAQFGSMDEQEQWSIRTRQYIPYNLGLGLVNVNGEIAGDPNALRIGDACIRDMHRFLGRDKVPVPIIHREVEGQEHFDIISPVTTTDGEPAGLLFASYRIELLESWITGMDGITFETQLLDHQHHLIVSSGTLNTDSPIHELETQIPGNDLYLKFRFPIIQGNPIFTRFLILNAIAVLLIIVLLFTVARRALYLYHLDLNLIGRILTKIQHHQDIPEEIQSHLKDTQQIMRDIHALAGSLSESQTALSHDSRHDALTGLPNRRYLERHLEKSCSMVKRGAGFTVAIIDIDYFKQVNDQYGHSVGDDILKMFANAARQSLRESDFAARYAGDEFVLIFFEMASTQKSINAINRIREQFKTSQQQAKLTGDLLATLSIGVYRMNPGETITSSEVIEFADQALYQAKDQGRNCTVDYRQWKELVTTGVR